MFSAAGAGAGGTGAPVVPHHAEQAGANAAMSGAQAAAPMVKETAKRESQRVAMEYHGVPLDTLRSSRRHGSGT